METQLNIVTPEIQKETETALTIINSANSLIIQNVTDYRYAQVTMKEVKDRISELTDTRMGQTRPLDQSKAKIMAFFAPTLEKLEKAKNYLDKIMVSFVEEQKAKEKEEERRLLEEARKRAENEALRQALEAEAAGEKEEAEEIIRTPVYVPPIRVMSEIPKSKESHIRETWSAELISLEELVHGIANGTAPLLAVKADMVFLNEQARAYKQSLKISGVRSVSKKTQI